MGWMRRMRFVSKRGVVAMVVVVGLVAACVGGWRLVRSLQYRAAVRVAASVRASATAAVADDVGVCDLVPAGAIESIAGRQINNFWMYRSNNKLMCLVYFQERKPLHYIDITYKNGPIGKSIKSSWSRSFEEVAARDGVTALTIEGLEGRGLLIADDNGAPSAVWEYPDGHYAAVRPSILGTSTPQDTAAATDTAATDIAVAVLTRVAPRLPAVAALPEVHDFSYPQDPPEADRRATTTASRHRPIAIAAAALATVCAAGGYRLIRTRRRRTAATHTAPADPSEPRPPDSAPTSRTTAIHSRPSSGATNSHTASQNDFVKSPL